MPMSITRTCRDIHPRQVLLEHDMARGSLARGVATRTPVRHLLRALHSLLRMLRVYRPDYGVSPQGGNATPGSDDLSGDWKIVCWIMECEGVDCVGHYIYRTV